MCLESKDYMQIRNALIILMRILPHFPLLQKLSQIIEKYVERVIEAEKNKRQDLFVLASSYIGQLKARSNDMMKEADFHQISDKPAKSSQDAVKAVNGNASSTNSTPLIGKFTRQFNFCMRSLHVYPSFPDVKEPAERVEKKSSSTMPSTLTSTVAAPSVKQSTSANNAEKESKKEVKERESTTEKSVSKERSSTKESKRDKDENDGGSRKRERGEKRRERERKTISPVPYFDAAPIDRYYSNDQYDDRERDRDLSSISNSSNGSTNRRSQESPDHDRGMSTTGNNLFNPKFCSSVFIF